MWKKKNPLAKWQWLATTASCLLLISVSNISGVCELFQKSTVILLDLALYLSTNPFLQEALEGKLQTRNDNYIQNTPQEISNFLPFKNKSTQEHTH